MSLILQGYNNKELRQLLDAVLQQNPSQEELDRLFGKQPYYFTGPDTGPVAPYHLFVETHEDEQGRLYNQPEGDDDPAVFGVKIPIAVRRRNPSIIFPQPMETITLVEKKTKQLVKITVESVSINETRVSTAWISASIDDPL